MERREDNNGNTSRYIQYESIWRINTIGGTSYVRTILKVGELKVSRNGKKKKKIVGRSFKSRQRELVFNCILPRYDESFRTTDSFISEIYLQVYRKVREQRKQFS